MAIARGAYEIEVWGTILYIEVASTTIDRAAIDDVIDDVKKFVVEVDNNFSTYKESSFVSRLRRREIEINQCPQDVQDVWAACLNAHYLSDGAFDPWKVEGGFDPSGFVKGWAADKVAEILLQAGCAHIQVNAAGDLTLRGGNLLDGGEVEPWKIGISNPDNTQEVLRIFEIFDGAIATSGHYERGAHITDPYTGLIAIGAKSATVLGPDGGITDAMATALMVTGDNGAKFFTQLELAEYSAWCIDRHEGTAWGVGPALADEIAAQIS
ncbi:Flavin transferase ApbE [Candidatus Nanopelagicaceae bacterium]